ncbi:MAG: ADP-ribosylglycohydrolase family protein [Chloroflexi bacterium]|nr:ADP-ribosylglycohydrolase family protein [Chloroflexota bacterium]
MVTPRANQFAGCLIGQCLGDAAGFIVEGYPPQICRQYVDEILRPGKVEGQSRGGFSFGQYSDDSQLARELLQSFAACGKFDPSDYAGRIAAIFREKRIVGAGYATAAAAQRLLQGLPWDKAGTFSPAAGNGSAMRAGPIGLLFYDDPAQMIRAAHDQGRITHQDRRCSAGAIAIAGAVALALQQETIEPISFTAQLSAWVRPFDHILADALEQMPEWVLLPPHEAVSLISRIGLVPGYSGGWVGISPFVTSSVLWSLYAFLRWPEDYWEAICAAIAVGGDVDTTAAMTGAISGAIVGLEGIPFPLARHLNDRGTWKYGELVLLAQRCYEIKMGRKPED